MIIIINGVPGSGKTTIAHRIASLLGIDLVIQTDTIKEIFRMHNLPEISYTNTHEAWKFISSEKTSNTVIAGFRKHAEFYERYISKLAEVCHEKKHIIIEGVQATPKLFDMIKSDEKMGFYLKIPEKEEHLGRFELKNLMRREKNSKWYANYNSITLIEEHLLKLAENSGFKIINNNSIDETIVKIISSIKGEKNEPNRL
ncbi:MAG: AAA family ATPase [Candidatus Nanoarchaeia archaeon]|nr:AAA family ATPase [Candidatus Nanoarchaeia archaeon]